MGKGLWFSHPKGPKLKESHPDVIVGTYSMENKNPSPSVVQGQLDFNAPLLSVRRYAGPSVENERLYHKEDERSGSSSKLVPPEYRPELKSGPLRKAGTVPFLWEQSPGRPKEEVYVKANHAVPMPQAPRLPPGRTLAAKQAQTEKEDLPSSGDANTSEPGKRITADRSQQSNKLMNGAPPKNSKYSIDRLASNVKDKSAGSDSCRPYAGMHLSQTYAFEDDMDLDDRDTFSDAAETLSQTESCTVACSVSIVSGMEDQGLRSGRFVDPQTRNFMIDRFLPAAKAMASESPQYSSRRPPLQDPTRHAGKRREDRGPLPFQSRPYFMKQEMREEDHDISGFSPKACGFFSWRLRNAFSHLNPVPQSGRMSKKKHLSLLSAQDKGKPQRSLSDEVSSSDTDDEEQTWEEIYRQKLGNGTRPSSCLRKERKLRSFSSNTSPEIGDALMNRLSYGSDSQTSEKTRTSNRGSVGGISPYRNEAPVSPFHEGMGFLGFPKEFREENTNYLEAHRKSCNSINGIGTEDSSFWQSPSFLGHSLKSTPVSPTYERTVCVNSVCEIGPSKIKLGASEHKELMKGNESNIDVLVADNQKKSQNVITESGLVSGMNLLEVCKDCEILKSKTFQQAGGVAVHTSMEGEQPSCSDRTNNGDNESDSREDDIVLGGATDLSDSLVKEGWPFGISSKSSEVSDDSRTLGPSNTKSENPFPVSSLPPPLPPPLPKSPSESWLWRAMPLVTSPNSPLSPHAGFGSPITKQQGLKASTADPKWEAIVKSTYTQPGHLRFSEELNRRASPSNGS